MLQKSIDRKSSFGSFSEDHRPILSDRNHPAILLSCDIIKLSLILILVLL